MSKLAYTQYYTCKMQEERFKFFKSQNPETGNFDVTFEIEGKKLFAHRFILMPVSEYLNAMLSDRWSNKNEIIKIESFTYDNFYQFLCFLYSGTCNVTNENVFQLIDMGEFYGVSFFKDNCDRYFQSNIGIFTLENYKEMFEFSQNYSLTKMQLALKVFICSNFDDITKAEKLFSYEKPFMYLLSSVNYSNEKVFEVVYKWTEHQVMKERNAEENETFNLLEAVKAELISNFPKIYYMDITKMEHGFLMNFFLEKGFLICPYEFKALFIKPSHRTEDVCFKCVYDLAEKQSLQKQKKSSDGENFNIVDSIKTDLSEVFKIVQFHKMKETFLMDFVVQKGIFLSANEIKAIYNGKSSYSQEYRFKLVYELAERQSKMKQELSPDASFNLIDSIKADLAEIMPTVNFSRMTNKFLMDFVAAKGFLLGPAEFAKILYLEGYDKVDFVYELAEKQALKKQEIFSNENFNLTNSIKADLSCVISGTKWYKMKNSVFMDFFVAKGIITKEQASHVCDTRISITNNGKTITGVFKDEIGIRDVIEDETGMDLRFSGNRRKRGDKCVAMQSNTNKIRYLKLKFSIPKTKSTLKKMKGVEWYLCLEKDGVLTFKHEKMVNPSDYLITEMKSETEFTLTANETTSINACYNNLNPII